MKTFVLVIISVLPLQLQSIHATSPEEVKFVATVKQAFEKHDAAVLVAMTCWDRVPDKFKDSGKKQYARDVAQKTTDNIKLLSAATKVGACNKHLSSKTSDTHINPRSFIQKCYAFQKKQF